ncbi:MAG: DinB family protein [Balneolaceae bacterium]|nr:DinB family protein [Balneolaceae bacterium]
MPDEKSYQDLIQIFNSAKNKADSFREIPDERFFMKPAPDQWSVDDICRHLILFNTKYISSIEKAAKTFPVMSESKELFEASYLIRLSARYLEPPYKMKIKTIKPFRPEPGSSKPDKSESVSRLEKTQEALIDLLNDFRENRIDLEKTRGKNPVFSLIKMSVIDFIVLLDAHQRRHFWQLEQTLEKIQHS